MQLTNSTDYYINIQLVIGRTKEPKPKAKTTVIDLSLGRRKKRMTTNAKMDYLSL